MRTFAVFTVAIFAIAAFSVFFFSFGTTLVAQPGGQGVGVRMQVAPVQVQQGMQQQGVQQRNIQQQGMQQQGGGQRGQMQQGGGQPPWGQGAQGAPTAAPGGRGAQPAAQNQQARPVAGQPATLNPNQVTQMIARLRAMDTNQNGVLEASEIPANQRERVNTIIAQLGGNPNAASINLANLERRAMAAAGGAAAGGAQPNQPQQQQTDNARQQQQRQQQPPPLVPAFGEQVRAETPPLGFGQRAPAVQATPQANRGTVGQQRNAANPQQSFVPPAIVRTSAPLDNIPASLRNNANISWFFEFDTDQDGQLSMQEYVAGRGGVWTQQIADEFAGFGIVLDINGNEVVDVGLDRNGDGFATLDEVLLTISERSAWWPQGEGVARQATASTATRAGQQGQQVRQPPAAASATTPANVRPQPGSVTNQGNAPARMQGGPQMGNNPQMGPGGRGGANQQQPGRGGRGG